jgi:hypothetical protein
LGCIGEGDSRKSNNCFCFFEIKKLNEMNQEWEIKLANEIKLKNSEIETMTCENEVKDGELNKLIHELTSLKKTIKQQEVKQKRVKSHGTLVVFFFF